MCSFFVLAQLAMVMQLILTEVALPSELPWLSVLLHAIMHAFNHITGAVCWRSLLQWLLIS
jgi:hypothetical protein